MPELYHLCADQFGYAHYVGEVIRHECRCEWKVWAVYCWNLAKEPELQHHDREGDRNPWSLSVEQRVDAAVFLHGDVKWDAISDWYFDEQDHCMLHFDEKDPERLGQLFRELYEISGRAFRERHPGLWKDVGTTEAKPVNA